ncbi:hypothetical protein BS50DRAFT_567988 [Corynespora cassiicola Philippines]|uniref:Uncharacterized protein n=1 Tax=Corynespora cassiicola Philippines TaxID=1448308 RepID=A0A2T2PCD0_CORCC|nr:hypothetical protein BS50DRAFT_567988 [Corynespora cassiicola Philippines]
MVATRGHNYTAYASRPAQDTDIWMEPQSQSLLFNIIMVLLAAATLAVALLHYTRHEAERVEEATMEQGQTPSELEQHSSGNVGSRIRHEIGMI